MEPTPPCSPEVSRAISTRDMKLLRSGHWQARQLPTDEVPASLRCVCDESWGIRCLWHRCEGYFSQEMRNIHDNGQGITIWKGLDHIDDLDPGFLLQHKRKCEEYLSWSNRRRERESKKPWIPFRTEDIEGSSEIAEMQIMTWLNLNIKEPRDFRQTQLYIYGPPKMGKSTLIRI